MKVKPKAYIKCDICGNEMVGKEIFGYRRIKVYEWFYEWSKYDLCRDCASTLENMVREKVQKQRLGGQV